jgi:hypothetical protein
MDTISNGSSLYNEIRDWNHIETRLSESFRDKQMDDRDYRKMKLAEYDRIYFKYRSAPMLTKDEKALFTMLQYQRRKLARAIYPKLLTRLLLRTTAKLSMLIGRSKEATAMSHLKEEGIINQTIPLWSNGTNGDQGRSTQLDQPANEQERKMRYGQDLGGKTPFQQQKGNLRM